MKKLLLSLMTLPLLTFFDAYGVSPIIFTYDNAGNMIKRSILSLKPFNSPKEDDNDINMLADKTLNIYPNPTDGPVNIDITGLTDSDIVNILLFSIDGKQLEVIKVKDSKATLNLSSRPSGMYFLLVIITGENKSWKIIRK